MIAIGLNDPAVLPEHSFDPAKVVHEHLNIR